MNFNAYTDYVKSHGSIYARAIVVDEQFPDVSSYCYEEDLLKKFDPGFNDFWTERTQRAVHRARVTSDYEFYIPCKIPEKKH
jgi:hypothetical protein